MQDVTEQNEQAKTEEVKTRPIEPADIQSLLEIEQEAFEHPWSSSMFEGEMNNCFSSGYITTIGTLTAGYIFYWILFDELHIVNLATRRRCRRKSVASNLLRLALKNGARHGVEKAMLEVRFSNEAAICMYEKFSFKVDFIRKNYYSHPREDASVMKMDYADLLTESGSRL